MATPSRSSTRPAWTTEPSVLVAGRSQTRAAHPQVWRSTYAAFVWLGVASCFLVNTTYIELSHLMLFAPEKLLIFPYSVFALQSANVYPIMYAWLNPEHRSVSVSMAAWICLVCSLIISICVSYFWDSTTLSQGAQHSVVFLVLTHLGGMTNGVFSTTIYEYVASFPSIYTGALATGIGLSGVLIALLGLWQAPYAAESAFSVSAFYVVCALVSACAMVAFGFIVSYPSVNVERQRIIVSSRHNDEHHKIHTYDTTFVDTETHARAIPSTCTLRQRVFGWFWRELTCQTLLAALYHGVLPSISAFLFVRYSPLDPARAAEHQLLATAFTFFVNPFARFLSSTSQLTSVYISTLFLLAASVLLISCTLLSEPPGSTDHAMGFLLPLILYITSSGVHTYTQAMLSLTIKQQADCTRDVVFADSVTQWSTVCIQMGAFAGALVVFPIAVAWPQLFQPST